jgi:uncharacterized membrane protein YjdF
MSCLFKKTQLWLQTTIKPESKKITWLRSEIISISTTFQNMGVILSEDFNPDEVIAKLIALWTDAVKTIPKYTFDEAPANCANHKRKKLVLMLRR